MSVREKPPIEVPPEADSPEQSRRFIDMAREIEADETPGAFDRAFDRVIKRDPFKRRNLPKSQA